MNIPTAELESSAAADAADLGAGRDRGEGAWPARRRSLRLSPSAAEWLPAIRRRLIDRFHPERIVLFGSQARGDATERSDIDLLVVMPRSGDRRQASAEMYAALRGIPVGTDIVVVSLADVERYGHLTGTIIAPALQEGATIYARAGKSWVK